MLSIKPLTRLLFLDFDGVLHPVFPSVHLTDDENQHFSYLPRFEAWLRRHPEAEVVITSTWRRTRSLATLRSFFSPDIQAQIIGSTPMVGSGVGPHARQKEVDAWLSEAGRKEESWVALDDMPDLFSPGSALVVTNDGFREAEEKSLDTAWSNPAAWAKNNPVVHGSEGILWLPSSSSSCNR